MRHEVATQLERIDPKSLESLANQVAEVLKKSAKAGHTPPRTCTTEGRQARQDVTTKAGNTAKGVTSQASKTAKGVTTRPTRRPRGTAMPPPRWPRRSSRASDPVVPAEVGAKKSHAKKASQATTRLLQEGRQLTGLLDGFAGSCHVAASNPARRP